MGKDIEVAEHGRDYQDPPPVDFFDAQELGSSSFYRAIIAEFVATLLFLYITVLTVIGYKSQSETDQCGGVGILGIAWANELADGYNKGTGLGAEIVGTFVLVYTVFSATDPKRNARDSHVPVLAPLPIGFTVFMVHLATIPITGTGINPARSFGAAVIYGKEKAWDDQKTSAYISQNDVHVGEMTVKETLDFSARCQGVGSRYELLTELARREKDVGIFPEAEIDLFMKATSIEGVESSLFTDYTLRILGLDVCRDTIVGDNMIRGISGGQKKRVTTDTSLYQVWG